MTSASGSAAPRDVYESFLLERLGGRLIAAHLERFRASVGAVVDTGGIEERLDDLRAELPDICASLGLGEVVKFRLWSRAGVLSFGVESPTPRLPIRLALVEGFDDTNTLRQHKGLDRAWAERALATAKANGADDALLVDSHGRLGEATSANLFLVLSDGTVATPPRGGIVPGVVRQWLLDACDAVERTLNTRDAHDAREAFLSTAGRGIVPVTAIGSREFPTHAVAEELHRRWCALPLTTASD